MCDHVPIGDQAAAALAAPRTASRSTRRLRHFPFPRQPLSSLAAGEFGRASDAFGRPLSLSHVTGAEGRGAAEPNARRCGPTGYARSGASAGAPL